MTVSINLNDKKAIVTGVSSGIGLGIATVLAEAGCDIAGCGLDTADSSGAAAFINRVEANQRRANYQTVDLTDDGQLCEWVKHAVSWLGGVDFVVSNAGASIFEGITDCTPTAWDAAMRLNLASHWRLSQEARPHLLGSPEPTILIIASNHAHYTIPGCFPYNVAKAGLVAFVQSLAIEWGPDIRAVGIAPGFIDTPGGDAWFNTFPDAAAERARTETSHPVGRIGTPEEIGGLCAFLCSPYARFISGTTLLVDGGRSALMQDG